MLKSLKPSLLDLCGLIFLLCILISGRSFSGDPGVGWHLKAGEVISQSISDGFQSLGPGVFSDPFLYSKSNGVLKSWINNQYLSDLLFYKTYELGGFGLLESLVVIICTLSFISIPFLLLKKFNTPPLLILFLLILTAFQAAVQFPLRPVIFSFFLFSLLNYLIHLKLSNKIKKTPALVSFFTIFAFWANLHPAFILGLILILLACISSISEAVLEKNSKGIAFWRTALVVSTLATFLTPFKTLLWKNIFGLAGNKFFMNLNLEWLSPNFYAYHNLPFLLSLCILIYFAFGKQKVKLTYFEYLSLAVFLFLSIQHIRNIGFFALVSVLPLAKLLTPSWNNWREGTGELQKTLLKIEMKQVFKTGLFYSHLLLFCFIFIKFNEKYTLSSLNLAYPKKSLEIIRNTKPGSKIFHSPNLGGYITWSSWPSLKPWIDDRNQLNGQTKYIDFFNTNLAKAGWQAYLNEEEFDFIVIGNESFLNKILIKEQNKNFKNIIKENNYSLWQRKVP